jgi:hypothetical protein
MSKSNYKKIFTVLFLLIFSVCAFAQTPQYYNFNNGTVNNSFPLNQVAGKMSQTVVPANTFISPTPAPAGNISKLYFLIAATYPLGPATYSQFRIMVQHVTSEFVTSGSFITGAWDTVYKRDTLTLSAAGGTWLQFTLDHPFAYNPTQPLAISMEQCGATGTVTGYSLTYSTATGNRRIYSVGGCPYVYSGVSTNIINCGIDISSAPPVSVNRVLKLATPGVNTTYVQVPYMASMVGFGNNITIEAWIKPGGTTTAATVLNKGVASFDYQLGVSLSTMLPFFRAGSTIATCPFPIQANVWQHLAVVSNGSTVTFYLNGVPGAPVTAACILGSSANEMRIARGNSDAGSGWLDEIRVWSVARTAPEILSNVCNKWIPNNTAGLKAQWHFDSTFVDSVSGWNGVPMGTAGFDTMSFCPIVTNIPVYEGTVPSSYKLEQNYPNPFNPSTTIKFSIPKDGYVTIKLYDMLGKEITTLVSDPYRAGEYRVDFNASNLPSGTYFYRLEANGFTDTKKMILIK